MAATGRSRTRAIGEREQGSVLITPELLRRWKLPEPDGRLGKEGRGKVLVVGGSQEIPGGIILAAVAALRAGAGTLQIATSKSVAPWVAVTVPEARVIGLREGKGGELAPQSCRAVEKEMSECAALLVGPGMMDADAGAAVLLHCARAPNPTLIVDAAPLRAFAERTPLQGGNSRGVIVTPHAGEMARMWGVPREEVLASPLLVAKEAAKKLNAIVALKGSCTYVAAPDGRVFHNTAGNAGLGTSGSGDTLSGVIAGLSARGADPVQSAVWGVYLHAKAGDVLARRMGPLGFLARELLTEIPELMARLSARPRSSSR